MLKIWCMFDNYTFARIEITDRDGIGARARELIGMRRGATFFAYDENDAIVNSLTCEFHNQTANVDDWLDRVAAELSFRKAMAA